MAGNASQAGDKPPRYGIALNFLYVELVFQLVHPIGVSHSFNGIIRWSIRFNVNKRRPINHVQPFNLEYISISFNHFNGGHANGIRSPRATAGKYTDLWYILFPLR